jgi:hypothetical protein
VTISALIDSASGSTRSLPELAAAIVRLRECAKAMRGESR